MSDQGISVFAVSAVLLIGVLAATPAAAGPKNVVVTGTSSELMTREVSHRDLNLASAQDEKKLVRRVHSAVGRVCVEMVGHSMAI